MQLKVLLTAIQTKNTRRACKLAIIEDIEEGDENMEAKKNNAWAL